MSGTVLINNPWMTSATGSILRDVDETNKFSASVIAPVIAEGDPIGQSFLYA